MTDIFPIFSDLEFAALAVNAGLLVVIGLAMVFADEVNRLGARLVERRADAGFFPITSPAIDRDSVRAA